jgi:hypothetical protein
MMLHGHKSKKEMLGCVPFGLLPVYLRLVGQSVVGDHFSFANCRTMNGLLQNLVHFGKQNAP